MTDAIQVQIIIIINMIEDLQKTLVFRFQKKSMELMKYLYIYFFSYQTNEKRGNEVNILNKEFIDRSKDRVFHCMEAIFNVSKHGKWTGLTFSIISYNSKSKWESTFSL